MIAFNVRLAMSKINNINDNIYIVLSTIKYLKIKLIMIKNIKEKIKEIIYLLYL